MRFEEDARSRGYNRVAGVDEVGRGPLAGPVVAAAVIWADAAALDGIRDSKQLTPRKRFAAYQDICREALAIGIGVIDAEVIDRINILEATRSAMTQALSRLAPAPDCVLVDAVALPGLGTPALPLVRADGLAYAVACASILAKVERDDLMAGLDESYPQYGFAGHKGYPTREHLAALRAVHAILVGVAGLHGHVPLEERLQLRALFAQQTVALPQSHVLRLKGLDLLLAGKLDLIRSVGAELANFYVLDGSSGGVIQEVKNVYGLVVGVHDDLARNADQLSLNVFLENYSGVKLYVCR